jgi:hypothetical protein
MENKISANYSELLRQAQSTVHDYMHNAVHNIDELFETGYAEQHPELVAAYMKVAMGDFNCSVTNKTIQELLPELILAIESLKPVEDL